MLGRSIRIYSLYFIQFLKVRLSYRADFVAALLSSAISSVTGVLFVVFLVDGTQIRGLGGWSREEVLFIYGYSYLSTALFSTVSLNLYGFGSKYIIDGQFDRVLLRPLNSLCQVIFESFNIESLGNFIAGLVILEYARRALGLSFSVVDYCWLATSSVCGALIILSVLITVSSLSFHFEDRLGISAPVFNLLNFSRFPVSIFNRTVQMILSFIIPFAFAAFYPATYFFNNRGFEGWWYLSPVIAAFALSFASLAWSVGVARYSSTGS